MAYHHHVNTHHRIKRSRRVIRSVQVLVLVVMIGGAYIGVDWLLTKVNSAKTVVSSESSATVQSAKINIFQTPYYRFQADASWREVTDELLSKGDQGFQQYLYRSFDKNFIEHELWVAVNLPENYTLQRHNIPTRVVPVKVQSDGTLSELGDVSDPCGVELADIDKNLEPHIIVQKEVQYLCNLNAVNDYTVVAGVPGGTNRLPMPHGDAVVNITITYRNITATPDSRQFLSILNTFKSN